MQNSNASPFGFRGHSPSELFDRLFLQLRDAPWLEAVDGVNLYPPEQIEHVSLRDVFLRLRVNLYLPCERLKTVDIPWSAFKRVSRRSIAHRLEVSNTGVGRVGILGNAGITTWHKRLASRRHYMA